jgi:hypothetical protein
MTSTDRLVDQSIGRLSRFAICRSTLMVGTANEWDEATVMNTPR